MLPPHAMYRNSNAISNERTWNSYGALTFGVGDGGLYCEYERWAESYLWAIATRIYTRDAIYMYSHTENFRPFFIYGYFASLSLGGINNINFGMGGTITTNQVFATNQNNMRRDLMIPPRFIDQ